MNEPEIIAQQELAAISHIAAVPLILEMICKTTGMGFAAVARVTPEQWIACAVQDDIQFGLRPGGELKVDTTICHEIRQSGQPVLISDVSKDEFYAHHHTPSFYGLQSYISVPIVRQDGQFFGTLCAIDPNPAILNVPQILGMFKTYAALISFHLNAGEQETAERIQQLERRTVSSLHEQMRLLFGDSVKKEAAMERNSNRFNELLTRAVETARGLLNELTGVAKV